jgi:hypothetical protein
VTHDPNLTANRIREQLSVHEEIVHSTIEIHQAFWQMIGYLYRESITS